MRPFRNSAIVYSLDKQHIMSCMKARMVLLTSSSKGNCLLTRTKGFTKTPPLRVCITVSSYTTVSSSGCMTGKAYMTEYSIECFCYLQKLVHMKM